MPKLPLVTLNDRFANWPNGGGARRGRPRAGERWRGRADDGDGGRWPDRVAGEAGNAGRVRRTRTTAGRARAGTARTIHRTPGLRSGPAGHETIPRAGPGGPALSTAANAEPALPFTLTAIDPTSGCYCVLTNCDDLAAGTDGERLLTPGNGRRLHGFGATPSKPNRCEKFNFR